MDGVQLLLVIIAAVAVTGLANRKGLQPPLVLVVVGLAVSFIPGLPRLEFEPEIILGLVLPPLLYSAALDFSVAGFIRNLNAILQLGVLLVLVTTVVVGVVAGWVVPSLTLASALVLGAVVAPPDAVTAVAIGRRLGVPKRVMTILTGESLVNDAAALTLFSVTVAGIAGTRTVVENPLLFFGYTSVVGVLTGLLIGITVNWLRRIVDDAGLETVLGLVVPFSAYLVAEQLHGSGVLAVVTAGFWLGHHAASAGFQTRLQERQVWQSIDVLLEAFVFAYMGLQLRFLIEDVRSDGEPLGTLILSALAILLAVIVVRPLFLIIGFERRRLTYNLIGRHFRARWRDSLPMPLTWRPTVLISWTGMRGVVTLAAASGVPVTTADGGPFPGRSSIQFIAFVVAVGTLLIQGPTLPALVARLNLSIEADRTAYRTARRHARAVSQQASRTAVRELLADPPDGVDPRLLEDVAQRLREAQETRQNYGADAGDPDEQEAAQRRLNHAIGVMRQHMLTAQRAALIRERDAGALDDDVLRDVLEQLDIEEASTVNARVQRL